MREVFARPLTRAAFEPFGDVLDTDWHDHYPINGGLTERYNAMAEAEAAGPGGHVVMSIFRGRPYDFPLTLTMVERHPLGSQAFMPLSPAPFLVVVCNDDGDMPGQPQAFLTAPGQGVNYRRNVWHAVLTPIGQPQDFFVVDSGGQGDNLEEFFFDGPWQIHLPAN